jgi:hypothetical protein
MAAIVGCLGILIEKLKKELISKVACMTRAQSRDTTAYDF